MGEEGMRGGIKGKERGEKKEKRRERKNKKKGVKRLTFTKIKHLNHHLYLCIPKDHQLFILSLRFSSGKRKQVHLVKAYICKHN